MAKKVLSLRLDDELVAAIDEYAAGHGLSRTRAVEVLVGSAMSDDGDGGAKDSDEHDDGRGELLAALAVLRESNVTLRETVASLTARLSEAMQIADHAQQLHALAEKKLLPPDESERLTMGERWRRWWSGK